MAGAWFFILSNDLVYDEVILLIMMIINATMVKKLSKYERERDNW